MIEIDPIFDEMLYADGGEKVFNVCLVGEVSCGKTTFLNSLFLEKYGDTKRIRSTGAVNIYSESYGEVSSKKDILEKNKAIDDTFQENGSKGKVIVNRHLVKPIPHLDNPRDFVLNIIDIPGLNDGGDSELFIDWYKTHANYFDVIVFIIDGTRALTTKSEIDLLEIILYYIDEGYQKFLPIINKIDDPDDIELIEVIATCNKTLKTIAEKINNKLSINPIPMTAELAFTLFKFKKDLNVDDYDHKFIKLLVESIIGRNWKAELEIKNNNDFLPEEICRINNLLKEKIKVIDSIIPYTGYLPLITLFNSIGSLEAIETKRLEILKRQLYRYFSCNEKIAKNFSPNFVLGKCELLKHYSVPEALVKWLSLTGIPANPEIIPQQYGRIITLLRASQMDKAMTEEEQIKLYLDNYNNNSPIMMVFRSSVIENLIMTNNTKLIKSIAISSNLILETLKKYVLEEGAENALIVVSADSLYAEVIPLDILENIVLSYIENQEYNTTIPIFRFITFLESHLSRKIITTKDGLKKLCTYLLRYLILLYKNPNENDYFVFFQLTHIVNIHKEALIKHFYNTYIVLINIIGSNLSILKKLQLNAAGEYEYMTVGFKQLCELLESF